MALLDARSRPPPPPPTRLAPTPKSPAMPSPFDAFASNAAGSGGRQLFRNSCEAEVWQHAMRGQLKTVQHLLKKNGLEAATLQPQADTSRPEQGDEVSCWPPAKFQCWALPQYVILQQCLFEGRQPLNEDAVEAYGKVYHCLTESEIALVDRIVARARNRGFDGSDLFLHTLAGDLIGHRCDDWSILQFGLWQAALGRCDCDYFVKKLQSVIEQGGTTFATAWEVQVAHPRECSRWSLRMYCRAGAEKVTEKLSVLLQHEKAMVQAAARAILDDAMSSDEREWLAAVGVSL
eukprot:s3399_g10.t1